MQTAPTLSFLCRIGSSLWWTRVNCFNTRVVYTARLEAVVGLPYGSCKFSSESCTIDMSRNPDRLTGKRKFGSFLGTNFAQFFIDRCKTRVLWVVEVLHIPWEVLKHVNTSVVTLALPNTLLVVMHCMYPAIFPTAQCCAYRCSSLAACQLCSFLKLFLLSYFPYFSHVVYRFI